MSNNTSSTVNIGQLYFAKNIVSDGSEHSAVRLNRLNIHANTEEEGRTKR